MSEDVTVVRDEVEAYADGTVARVRILAVPESEKFPDGIKYAFHYGDTGADDPIIRFDNTTASTNCISDHGYSRPTTRDYRRCIAPGVQHFRSTSEPTGDRPTP